MDESIKAMFEMGVVAVFAIAAFWLLNHLVSQFI